MLRRAHFTRTSALNMFTGYGLGELDLVYLGQMQTRPTLIGYIEGAPPVPSENLSRPLYQSVFAYNTYLNATSVRLQQTDMTTLTVTSQDYRTTSMSSFDAAAGDSATLNLSSLFGPFGPILNMATGNAKLGGRHTSDENQAVQYDETYKSSWTTTVSDTLGLRGAWEQEQSSPSGYLNPAVGRRYEPANVGYALVESLSADVYVSRLRSTGAMVDKVVWPNLDIPPDRNIITFQIDPGYVKNYPNADVKRGSYFKPEEAYRLAAKIEKADTRARTYFQQFDAESLGQHGPDAPEPGSPDREPVLRLRRPTTQPGHRQPLRVDGLRRPAHRDRAVRGHPRAHVHRPLRCWGRRCAGEARSSTPPEATSPTRRQSL